MLGYKLRDIEKIRKEWDKRAKKYDDYYKNFKDAVEHYIDLKLLEKYLPENKNAKILDAAGGTGRITLPLARMGYSVTLCDISHRMIDVARQKIFKAGLLDKVTILECNVCNMPFPDETFDLVICYGGGLKSLKELARVTKKKGKISMCAESRFGNAIRKFAEEPERALAIVKSKSDCNDYEEKYGFFSEKEARMFFKKKGIRIMDIYACDIWNSLAIPEQILESHKWNRKFFRQTVEIILKLAKEPSLRGISRRWVVYGEKV